MLVIAAITYGPIAYAIGPTAVGFGTANGFAVLAGSTITNTGLTVINGDMGVSPGSAVTGFAPGIVNGAQHVADAVAASAKADLITAYNAAAGQTPATTVATELGGTSKDPGIYDSAAGTFQITGALTLDAHGDPNAVFVFKAASTLVTAVASSVILAGNAQACNIYWQVGSSATIGANSFLKGSVLAASSITLDTGAQVDGRVLAQGGAVTLDSNTITNPGCAAGTYAQSSGSSSSSGRKSGGHRRVLPQAGTVVTVVTTVTKINSAPSSGSVSPHMPNSGIGPDGVIAKGRSLRGPSSRLVIPAIGVDAAIGYAGLLPDGSMDTPVSPDDVGVYSRGPLPGEEGSSVIAGHYGWYQKRAAAFDHLSKLVPGDIVSVRNADGSIVNFVVREMHTYDAGVDTSAIFYSRQGVHLNLLSCSGAWNAVSQSYGERLVIFTDLVI